MGLLPSNSIQKFFTSQQTRLHAKTKLKPQLESFQEFVGATEIKWSQVNKLENFKYLTENGKDFSESELKTKLNISFASFCRY